MESKDAVAALSSLAHGARLSVFRMLMQAGAEIARRLDVPPNTLSSNLNILSNAGLIENRREGRTLIYTARYTQMTELLEFLIHDCCSGQLEICAPLADVVLRSRCLTGGTA